MCRNGYKINRALADSIKNNEADIRDNKALSDIFINNKTNQTLKINELVKMPLLARTFEIISESNISSFYSSDLTKLIVKEINENGDFCFLFL